MMYSSAFVARASHGKGWRCVLSYKDGDTWRTKSKTFRDCKSKLQAKKLLQEWRSSIESKEVSSCDMSVYAYGMSVVNTRLELSAILPATAADYAKSLSAWNKYLDCSLSELSKQKLEQALIAMSKDVSTTTTLKRYIALNMILDNAVKDGFMQVNPLKEIPRPKKAKSIPNSIVGDDLARLSHDLLALPLTRWSMVARLCYYIGLRAEECGALTYADVDMQERIIWIRHAIGYGKGGAYLAPPKNGRTRDIHIPSALYSILQKWIDFQKVEYAKSGKKISPSDYLLAPPNSSFIDVRNAGRKWSVFADIQGYKGLAGRKPTLHDLRHTFATACIKGGMDIKTLQSILGHSSAAITLDVYASCDPSAKKASVSIIESVL